MRGVFPALAQRVRRACALSPRPYLERDSPTRAVFRVNRDIVGLPLPVSAPKVERRTYLSARFVLSRDCLATAWRLSGDCLAIVA